MGVGDDCGWCLCECARAGMQVVYGSRLMVGSTVTVTLMALGLPPITVLPCRVSAQHTPHLAGAAEHVGTHFTAPLLDHTRPHCPQHVTNQLFVPVQHAAASQVTLRLDVAGSAGLHEWPCALMNTVDCAWNGSSDTFCSSLLRRAIARRATSESWKNEVDIAELRVGKGVVTVCVLLATRGRVAIRNATFGPTANG